MGSVRWAGRDRSLARAAEGSPGLVTPWQIQCRQFRKGQKGLPLPVIAPFSLIWPRGPCWTMDSTDRESKSPLTYPSSSASEKCWRGVFETWEGEAGDKLHGTWIRCRPIWQDVFCLFSSPRAPWTSRALGSAALTWLPITTGGTLDLGLQAPPRPPLQPPLPSLCTAFSQLRI